MGVGHVFRVPAGRADSVREYIVSQADITGESVSIFRDNTKYAQDALFREQLLSASTRALLGHPEDFLPGHM